VSAETYLCEECGGRFEKAWSDDEAAAERETLFPGVEIADCAVVCDDCFKLILAVVDPAALESLRAVEPGDA
jgi:hypothetical protein